jgi:hypothetical protein
MSQWHFINQLSLSVVRMQTNMQKQGAPEAGGQSEQAGPGVCDSSMNC